MGTSRYNARLTRAAPPPAGKEWNAMKRRRPNEAVLLTDFYRDTMQIHDQELLRECVQASGLAVAKAGEILFHAGQVPQRLCFLRKGAVRGFLIDGQGKDITDCIAYRCGESAMPESDFSKPASISIEAIVKTELVCIPMEIVKGLMARYPQLLEIYYRYLLQSADLHRELKIAVYKYTAQQRYEWFLRTYPGLIDQVSHKYIASLLNMTTVTLSKVRKAVRESGACGQAATGVPEPGVPLGAGPS